MRESVRLVDKYKNEIHQGDICRTRDSGKYGCSNNDLLICDDINEFIFTVMFSEEHSGLNGYTQNDLEIIGNIYDNPELLNEEKIEFIESRSEISEKEKLLNFLIESKIKHNNPSNIFYEEF